jgi:uncharacterized surface protein with fasciclin (FAS1) repeats
MLLTHSSRLFLVAALGLTGVGVLSSLPAEAKSCTASAANVAPETQAKSQAKTQTIVDVAAAAGSFNTLAAALKAAGLVEVLSGKGPFTVFAPTDAAFAALPQGTVETLLKPENKDMLVKVLTYHVVPGKVLSKDLKPGEVATVEGSNINIQLGESVKVNGAQVVKADIKASNGVIHVIDQVILPAN